MLLHIGRYPVEGRVVLALQLWAEKAELPAVALLVVPVLLALLVLVLHVLQVLVLVQADDTVQQEERFPRSIAHWCRCFFASLSGHQDNIQCSEPRLAGIVASEKEPYIGRL